MKDLTLMIDAACIALTTAPAAAQGVHRAGGPQGDGSLLGAFDRNGDGSLNPAEVDRFRAGRLAAL